MILAPGSTVDRIGLMNLIALLKKALSRVAADSPIKVLKRQIVNVGESFEMKSYSSYHAALQDCGAGYANDRIIEVVVTKNQLLSERLSDFSLLNEMSLILLRPLIGLATLKSLKKVSVLDFGGGGRYTLFCC